MHTFALGVLSFWFLTPFHYALSGTPNVRVIAYEVDAAITSFEKVVDVSLICDLQKADTVSQIELLFNSAARVRFVQCLAKKVWVDIPFKFTGKDTIRLHLPAVTHGMKALKTKFVYGFPVESQGDTLLILDRGHRWYPLIVDQIAKFKLSVEVPEGCTALSAGDLIESKNLNNRSQFVWKSDSPVFKLPLIVFRTDLFKLTSREVEGKKILLYFYLNDTLQAAHIIEEAVNVFKFYTGLLGEYSNSRLTLIEVPDFDGINVGSGLLTVGSSSIDQMKQGWFESLHLTIAQQWIGAGVFPKFGEPGFWFFSISLPHYLRLMYVHQKKGEDAFNKAMMQPLAKYREFAGKENDIPIIAVDFLNSREKGLVLYAKGPFVISKLHKQLGDMKWRSLLKDLYSGFQGKILTYDEFQRCLSEHDTSGDALSLLKRLLEQKGTPED